MFTTASCASLVQSGKMSSVIFEFIGAKCHALKVRSTCSIIKGARSSNTPEKRTIYEAMGSQSLRKNSKIGAKSAEITLLFCEIEFRRLTI